MLQIPVKHDLKLDFSTTREFVRKHKSISYYFKFEIRIYSNHEYIANTKYSKSQDLTNITKFDFSRKHS
jgi:hypothetical protein